MNQETDPVSEEATKAAIRIANMLPQEDFERWVRFGELLIQQDAVTLAALADRKAGRISRKALDQIVDRQHQLMLENQLSVPARPTGNPSIISLGQTHEEKDD